MIDRSILNGWVIPGVTDPQQMLDAERRYTDMLMEQIPKSFEARQAKLFMPAIQQKWIDFQLSRGRFAGSNDLTLIDQFIFGKVFRFLPQDIGSCVWSNTFRQWIRRMMVEIGLRGDAEEWIGSTEFGVTSIAPHCVTYGFARQRANMRSGDGLYKGPMQEELLKGGVVLCNNAKLKSLMDAAGATSLKDYPEPRSARLYRQIGNWLWNDALRDQRTCRLLESSTVLTIEDHDKADAALKPMFQCSSIAIKPTGVMHKDGFMISTEDRSDSWAHNMGWAGNRITSDGQEFKVLSNESWDQETGKYEAHTYFIRKEEVKTWYDRKRVDTATIGEIEGIESLPLI